MKKTLLFLLTACWAVGSFAQVTLTLQPDAAAGKDAEVFSCVPCGYNTRNFGNIGDLNAVAWTKNGNTSKIRSFIQFNLSSIPQGAVVTSARLSLYYTPNSDEGTHYSSLLYKNTSCLQRVTAPWDESTITWNNQPSTTTSGQVTITASTSGTQNYPNIDVKTLVQYFVNNPSQNYGMMLRLATEKPYRKLVLASSDNQNPALRPKLVITYTPPSPIVRTEIPSPVFQEAKTAKPPLDFSIIPNPAHADFKIFFSSNTSASLKILDLNGRVVYSKEIREDETFAAIPADNWNRGIYLVQVADDAGENILTRKLVLQ